MRRTERRKKKRNTIRKYFCIVITFLLLAILLYVGYGVYQESKIRLEQEEYETKRINLEEQEKLSQKEKEEQEKQERKEGVNVPEKYRGYEVDAYLEIQKLKLKTEVLKNYTKQGMEICVSKFWGPNPNEVGNYCIAGHNYITSKMFASLSNLKVGDFISLSDNENGKYTYIIYDIYRVKPENIEPLSQETNGKREITLITCSNYSQNRLIIKAAEE